MNNFRIVRKKRLDQLRADRLRSRVAELEQLIKFHQVNAKGAPEKQASIALATDSIAAAKALTATEAVEQGLSLQLGWSHCSQALRFLLWAMEPGQLEAHRKALRREAEEKLQNWRREAVLDLLGRELHQEGPVDVGALSVAQFLLDQHLENVYFKIDTVAVRIRGLCAVLFFLVTLVIAFSLLLPPSTAPSFLHPFSRTGVVLIAGALGALLSNTLTVLGGGARIPRLMGQYANWFVRLPLGALSALAVVIVLQSGLLPIEQPSELALYGWALAGGFSDQLLTKVLTKVENSIEK